MSTASTKKIRDTPSSGTGPNADSDAILSQELAKLTEKRLRMKEENQSYLTSHPELKTLLDEFVSSVISDKPHDIINYGAMFFKSKRSGGMGPAPIVVAGPSGVGKGTVVGILMKKYPTIFGFSVSHTTRQPRPGEENGVHYYFTSKAEMEQGITRGDFIEYANVHTNIYGTSFQAISDVRSKGKICILDIDTQGVQNVQKSNMDCKYIFINPPSMEELESRLRGRGTETEEKVQIRLKNAITEMEFGRKSGNFDADFVNQNAEKTAAEIVQKLEMWYPDIDFD